MGEKYTYDTNASLNSILQNSITTNNSTLTTTDTTSIPASSSLYISTAPNITSNYLGYATSDYTVSNSYYNDELFKLIINSLTEEELSDLVAKLQDRLDEKEYKDFINEVISSRHFSEKFILEYANNLPSYIYYIHHRADIVSKNYATLALRLEAEKI